MWQLTCRKCNWETLINLEAAIQRLRLVGHLRRDSEPDRDLVGELLSKAALKMTCPECQSPGLAITAADNLSDDDDWQTAVLCEVCKEPVPLERLEVLPEARRCVTCQNAVESGQAIDEVPEFCPKCGALVELRVSRGGGLTRYKRFCTGAPPCRL